MLTTCIRGEFIYVCYIKNNVSYTALVVPYELAVITINLDQISDLILTALMPEYPQDIFEVDIMGCSVQFTRDDLSVRQFEKSVITLNNHAKYISNTSVDIDMPIINIYPANADTIYVRFENKTIPFSRCLDICNQQLFYNHRLLYYYTIYAGKLCKSLTAIYTPNVEKKNNLLRLNDGPNHEFVYLTPDNPVRYF